MPEIIKKDVAPKAIEVYVNSNNYKRENNKTNETIQKKNTKPEKLEEINFENNRNQTKKYAIVTTQSGVLNIRSGMGTDTPIVDTAGNGSKLEVLEDSGNDWIKVKLYNGTTGYASAQFLRIEEITIEEEMIDNAELAAQDVASRMSLKTVTPSPFAIPAHTKITPEERSRRIQILGGEAVSEAEQDSKMQQITVPIWDGTKLTTMQLVVNKNLVTNFENVFKALANIKYKVFAEFTAAYDYNHQRRPSGAISDHALGGTIDLNSKFNWNSGDGSNYAIRNSEEVIQIFADQGFYWGGDWNKPDDMHFSWTGY